MAKRSQKKAATAIKKDLARVKEQESQLIRDGIARMWSLRRTAQEINSVRAKASLEPVEIAYIHGLNQAALEEISQAYKADDEILRAALIEQLGTIKEFCGEAMLEMKDAGFTSRSIYAFVAAGRLAKDIISEQARILNLSRTESEGFEDLLDFETIEVSFTDLEQDDQETDGESVEELE